MRAAAVVLLAVCAGGCGRYGLRVPSSVGQGLTDEARLALLDSENELAAALDKLDEAQSEIRRTRDASRRAAARLKAARAEVGLAADDSTLRVAELAVGEVEARLQFLRASQGRNVARREQEALAVTCAAARFERAKAAVARRMKIRGAEDLELEPFDAQVKACQAELAEQRGVQPELVAAVERAREAWEAEKALLAERTVDASASMFVE